MLDQLTASGSAVAGATRKRRVRRIIIIVLSLVLLLTVGAGAAYLAFLNHIETTNVTYEALLPAPDAPLSPGETVPVKEPAAKGAQNILLIGSDSRGTLANGRSDVIVLMHISNDRKKVHLVHFPRDLYVDVPGHGKDKINAAYAYGGAPLLVRTLQNLVNVPLDHVAIIGFEGFKAMTDAVGGVDVWAEEASSEPGFGTVHKGMNHLDGEAALGFVRERHQLSVGDISRGRRQMAFIKALMLKTMSKDTLRNPIRYAEVMDAGTKNLIVDKAFSMADMRAQAVALGELNGNDILYVTAPFSGFGTSPVGGSIDIVDQARMARLSIALRNDKMASYPPG